MQRSLSDEEPMLSRSKLLSKSKALSAARSVLCSYLGSAVIRNSTRETNLYQLELRRLELESAQRLRQLERSRTRFMTTSCQALQQVLAIKRALSTTIDDEARCCRTTWVAMRGNRRQRAPADDDTTLMHHATWRQHARSTRRQLNRVWCLDWQRTCETLRALFMRIGLHLVN